MPAPSIAPALAATAPPTPALALPPTPVVAAAAQTAFSELVGVAATLQDKAAAGTLPDDERLLRALGVRGVSTACFLAQYVLPRLGEIAPALRDQTTSRMLVHLPQLCGRLPGFAELVRGAAFVPAEGGGLRREEQLHDPEKAELRALLGAAHFPASSYAPTAAAVLVPLRSIGLRTELTLGGRRRGGAGHPARRQPR
jgi:hypothetical protein